MGFGEMLPRPLCWEYLRNWLAEFYVRYTRLLGRGLGVYLIHQVVDGRLLRFRGSEREHQPEKRLRLGRNVDLGKHPIQLAPKRGDFLLELRDAGLGFVVAVGHAGSSVSCCTCANAGAPTPANGRRPVGSRCGCAEVQCTMIGTVAAIEPHSSRSSLSSRCRVNWSTGASSVFTVISARARSLDSS